mmetsp:Transcript_57936/g.131282  ORF Transcript_57936/g.131282 Transcript_57936/m.131282 type:complete len:191 (-) Transcript_57936:517-1089(-)
MWNLLISIPLFGTTAAFTIALVFLSLRSSTHARPPFKAIVVLGSGGHTAEMMTLTEKLCAKRYDFYYVIAATDRSSIGKVEALRGCAPSPSRVFRIPRSREVGQSFFTSVFSTAHASLWSFFVVYRIQPHLVLANGPGTCLPICIAAFLFRTRIIFCESFCRVKSLSLTGRLVYPFVDRFIVQWPELVQK